MKSSLRWLIRLIAFVAIIYGGIGLSLPHESEFHKAWFIEGIDVTHFAPDIQTHCVSASSIHVEHLNCPMRSEFNLHSLVVTGRDIDALTAKLRRQELTCERITDDGSAVLLFQLIGGCVSDVLHSQSNKYPSRSIIFGKSLEEFSILFHNDISSQLSLCRILNNTDATFSRIGRLLGSISCALSINETFANEPQLHPKHPNLTTSEQGQYNSGAGQHHRPNDEAPFVRRFFLALGSLLLCALGGFLGFQAFYDKRLLVGACWIVSGLLLGSGGMLLLVLTIFRWSWGWWI